MYVDFTERGYRNREIQSEDREKKERQSQEKYIFLQVDSVNETNTYTIKKSYIYYKAILSDPIKGNAVEFDMY